VARHRRAPLRVAERDLRPRLEFVAECAPGLEEALAAAGFELEARIPVMTCARADARAVALPAGVSLGPVTDGADMRAYLEVQAEAFGQPPPSEEELAQAKPPARGLLARADGAGAGAGVHTAVAEGVSEIAGIGVRERFRRRGIAGAITAAAAAAAFAEGAELCFLTPGDDGAERVYARAGFARTGTTMVHMLG
jgi:GNAT superfamily N-acetyltransferase